MTSKGRRFRIENVTLWTVSTGKAVGMEGDQGKVLGQAAVFSEFTWLDDGDSPECARAPLARARSFPAPVACGMSCAEPCARLPPVPGRGRPGRSGASGPGACS